MPLLTIVLSTYNRPDALQVAIRSVMLQSFADWRLLVIGDCCDESTAGVVASFPDPRISYINLPCRCGEQAFPNSIGMVLAETEYIAFLNHDDVLLQDHLATAVRLLQEKGADLFIGRAAFARYSRLLPDGSRQPVFSEVNPVQRTLRDVFIRGFELFEPCSTWVFHRHLVDKVGLWRSSMELYRTPVEDWLLRSWRANAILAKADTITVLRMLTHYQSAKEENAYAWHYDEHKNIEQVLLRVSADEIRQRLVNALQSAAVARLPKVGFGNRMIKAGSDHEWLASRLLTPAMAEVYLRTGWDAFEQFCLLTGRDKGCFLNNMSRVRTGQAPPVPPDFSKLMAAARGQLLTTR